MILSSCFVRECDTFVKSHTLEFQMRRNEEMKEKFAREEEVFFKGWLMRES